MMSASSDIQLVIRQDMSLRWIWLLMTPDEHIVNRSDVAFDTKAACAADARESGF